MFYYLYEIKNNLNGMVYIGIHKTNNLNDGYMGSGKIIKQAIKKYGKNNFSKRILSFFQNELEMTAAEVEYVNEEYVSSLDTYNLVVGGGCGWSYVNKLYPNKPKDFDTRKKISKTLKESYPEVTREAVRVAARLPKSETQKKKAAKFYEDKTLIQHDLFGRRWVYSSLLFEYIEQGWFVRRIKCRDRS